MLTTAMRTPFAAALLLLLTLSGATTAAASAMQVKQFNIVNARTGKFVRVLRHNDVLDFPFPYAIVAIAPGARRVTFVSPWRLVEHRVPFAMPGDVKKGQFRPLRLNPGRRTVTAYANDNVGNKLSVSFTVRKPKKSVTKPMTAPALPELGPMPWQVEPSGFASDVKAVAIPQIKAGCARKTAPTISDFVVERSFYQYGDAQLDFKVNWCAGDNSLRVRVLSFEFVRKQDGSYAPRTKVLASQTRDFLQYGSTQLLSPSCKKQQIYIEACGKRPGDARPICGTSALKELFEFVVIEPKLLQRAPITLRLGPGDRPLITYALQSPGKDDPLPPRRYRLQIAAVAKNGRWLGASNWVSGTKITTRLPLSGRRSAGVKPWEYDGAEVFLRFAYQSCPSNVATLRAREKTTLVVKRGISKLARQDTSLPKLEKLVYPPTPLGQPVAMKIRATNPGNGRRADGTPTRLTYQWFMRDFDFGFSPSYPNLLAGETAATLKLARAECEVQSCGRNGCSDLKQYSVVVCNTFGCVLSNVVTPNITAPKLSAGQKWDAFNCEIAS